MDLGLVRLAVRSTHLRHKTRKPKVQFRSFVALEYVIVMKGMENYLSGIIIHI